MTQLLHLSLPIGVNSLYGQWKTWKGGQGYSTVVTWPDSLIHIRGGGGHVLVGLTSFPLTFVSAGKTIAHHHFFAGGFFI